MWIFGVPPRDAADSAAIERDLRAARRDGYALAVRGQLPPLVVGDRDCDLAGKRRSCVVDVKFRIYLSRILAGHVVAEQNIRHKNRRQQIQVNVTVDTAVGDVVDDTAERWDIVAFVGIDHNEERVFPLMNI